MRRDSSYSSGGKTEDSLGCACVGPPGDDATAHRTWDHGRRSSSSSSSSYPTLPYPTLPNPTLPYPTLPYPTLPYPARTSTAQAYPTLHYTTRTQQLPNQPGYLTHHTKIRIHQP